MLSKDSYEFCLKLIEVLMKDDPEPDSPCGMYLTELVGLVKQYEKAHFSEKLGQLMEPFIKRKKDRELAEKCGLTVQDICVHEYREDSFVCTQCKIINPDKTDDEVIARFIKLATDFGATNAETGEPPTKEEIKQSFTGKLMLCIQKK